MMGVVLLVRACDSDLAWLDYIGCLDHGVADLVREVGRLTQLLVFRWGQLHLRNHHRIVLCQAMELVVLGLLLVIQVVAGRWCWEVTLHDLNARLIKFLKRLRVLYLRLWHDGRATTRLLGANLSCSATMATWSVHHDPVWLEFWAKLFFVQLRRELYMRRASCDISYANYHITDLVNRLCIQRTAWELSRLRPIAQINDHGPRHRTPYWSWTPPCFHTADARLHSVRCLPPNFTPTTQSKLLWLAGDVNSRSEPRFIRLICCIIDYIAFSCHLVFVQRWFSIRGKCALIFIYF